MADLIKFPKLKFLNSTGHIFEHDRTTLLKGVVEGSLLLSILYGNQLATVVEDLKRTLKQVTTKYIGKGVDLEVEIESESDEDGRGVLILRIVQSK